ncbi:histidine utilization repressor [Novosphingobium sp. MD-1]|uniref:histidine utilization repressor n=1 Tax=Novosphingobium sp. MD-1 TaxID=1630648 RepID=UPI00061C6706|nr:histidine utilization repressor [Novosphingobium sp. MD-1]GAO55538.1 histidine utilization repressor [Novosphingobium sp. MD-1]
MTRGKGAETLSLSQRIRADIEEKIMSGAWRPGDRIPVEHELAAQYGCARMTVTRATEALAEAGLIVRRKRAGSFVAQPRIESAVLGIPDIPATIAERGKAYDLRLLSARRRVAAAGGEEDRFGGSGDVLEIDCLHLADGIPFAFEHRLISLAVVPAAAEADFSRTPPGTWLLAHVPWTEAEHRIGARAADARAAELLNIAKGAPCLMLERRTWRGDAHVTWVRQLFAADAFDLVARFTPKGDAAG